MAPGPAPGAVTPTSSDPSARSRAAVVAGSLTSSARSALSGPSGPALYRGMLGSALLTLGGFGAGALPVDGGPAAAVGLLGFTFGHGEVLALTLCWIGVALLFTAWLALGPRAVPMFSRDAWSYLAQGAMTAAGVDPYEVGPEANPGPFTDEVSPDWRSTATPYGPLHLLLMRIVVAVSGGHPAVGIVVLRVAVLVALAALTVVLVTAARRTGVDAGAAVWLACASPLSVIHLAGGLHNEIFPLVACLGAVVLALDGRRAWAGAAIGIAVAFKATAVIVAPFLLWILMRGERGSARSRDRLPSRDRAPMMEET